MGERREGNYRWDVIYKESILKMTQMGLVLTSFGQFSRYTTDDHIIFFIDTIYYNKVVTQKLLYTSGGQKSK